MDSPRHPLDPLTAREIQQAADVLQRHVPGSDIIFRVITLWEPPKAEMVVFLDMEHGGKETPKSPARVAKVQAHVNKTFSEFKVDLGQQAVVSHETLHGRHSHIDGEYMRKAELACMADARVKEQVASLDLPEGATVVVESWTYGPDGMNDITKRMTMCWFYMRVSDDPDANYYAYPLDLCVEMSEKLEVVNIFQLPSGENDRVETRDKPNEFDRRKIHEGSEYYPTLNTQQRTTTKPYHVSQPEGPSFAIDGNKISWEKWTLRVGFNYREGMTLHDIRFDGRSLFYRLSLAEMFVPYGDPRTPYPRKAAFDLGNDGAGLCANNLQLGCDCLGHIKYFDGWLASHAGTPLKLPNVVCCHEIDDGILWKHTNPRTGHAAMTRSRVLVLQTIITASNYEYIFLFYLGQDASIHYEVRATGILSTAPINLSTPTVPFGTVVAPGVMAPFHQHLFCLRIDPAIDGHTNSLVVEESHPLPLHPKEKNPHGVGYTTTQTYTPHETGLDLDHRVNRVFKMVNEHVRHPVTGTPVGFKLVPCYSQPLLAHPSSWHAKRSEFGAHAVWVTRYNHEEEDEEMFPAGRFTMQSEGGEGIASWIEHRRRRRRRRTEDGEGDDDEVEGGVVRDADIVVWHSFGSTHNPRAEDWPVMPVEKMVVGLKPVNFFERNPALDVAMATQERNLSVLVGGGGGAECCEEVVPGGIGAVRIF
ncbi:copper amine oxidase [Chaetomidium leptoderma]|uniref:Amine oxidase n=1 Tax=Chaetomidium leptoderma TaxID=669021 RepID=A0AAN6VT92_9PEZI|nr:copper amine oxidase [Chaetomidium leptoderma]